MNNIMPWGKFKGKNFSELPLYYLHMLLNMNQIGAEVPLLVKKELLRRQEQICYLSRHAYIQAKYRCIDLWKKNKQKREPFKCWLIRTAAEAFKIKIINEKNQYNYLNFIWIFSDEKTEKNHPLLITVYPPELKKIKFNAKNIS